MLAPQSHSKQLERLGASGSFLWHSSGLSTSTASACMGLPPYVLSPSTHQDGKKVPKWAHRARRGPFLGFTKNHSSMIGLLRIIQTGSILPQFHMVFEELFSTVHSLEEDNPTWVELFTSEQDYYGPDKDEEDAAAV